MVVVAQLVRASVFGLMHYKKHILQSSPFLRTFLRSKPWLLTTYSDIEERVLF